MVFWCFLGEYFELLIFEFKLIEFTKIFFCKLILPEVLFVLLL